MDQTANSTNPCFFKKKGEIFFIWIFWNIPEDFFKTFLWGAGTLKKKCCFQDIPEKDVFFHLQSDDPYPIHHPSTITVFFFYVNHTSYSENFCSCFREKSKLCVKKNKKEHVKNPKWLWNFWKNLLTENQIFTREKKMHAWKPKSCREKSGKSRWMYVFLKTFFNFLTICFGVQRFLYY